MSARRLRAGVGVFKNEREKGEEHYAVFDDDSACVAHVFSLADAELFSAAPDLLKACERMATALPHICDPTAPCFICAAIAKARGGGR